MPFMPQHALLKCFGVIACFLFAFHQKLGHSFVDIKTYCRPAFDRGQCQFWWESEGKGKRDMFVCLPAIGACSDCERPLPLLGNIIHQGGLRPDTGEDCLYTLSLFLSVQMHIPFCAGISCWMLSNFQLLLNLCVGWECTHPLIVVILNTNSLLADWLVWTVLLIAVYSDVLHWWRGDEIDKCLLWDKTHSTDNSLWRF